MSEYIQTLNTANMTLPKERKIITRHEYPPVPWRGWDWVAFREGDEESGPFYWGATQEDAINELREFEVVE
jgi:hypothetical protein